MKYINTKICWHKITTKLTSNYILYLILANQDTKLIYNSFENLASRTI